MHGEMRMRLPRYRSGGSRPRGLARKPRRQQILLDHAGVTRTVQSAPRYTRKLCVRRSDRLPRPGSKSRLAIDNARRSTSAASSSSSASEIRARAKRSPPRASDSGPCMPVLHCRRFSQPSCGGTRPRSLAVASCERPPTLSIPARECAWLTSLIRTRRGPACGARTGDADALPIMRSISAPPARLKGRKGTAL